MASAISEEEENGLRLRLVIEKAEDVLRHKFHQYFPKNPSDLYNKLSNTKNTKEIQKLLKKKVLHQDQYDLLLPVNCQTNSANFDLTLLTLLLRSLCKFKAPVTGWNDPPLQSDTSDAASLVRIRIARNKLQHGNLKYKEPNFTNFWNEICDPLTALGCSKQELLDIKTVSLDPLSQQQLHHIQTKLQMTMQQVSDLEDSLDGVTYNLLPTNPSFVGRNEVINEMHNELVTKDENKLALVISGLGGVGKTETIRAYCHQHISYYKNNIIWINAEQENSIATDFVHVAEQINLTIKDEGGKYIGTKAIIAKVYNYFAGRPVLFVFDNIIDNDMILDIISGSFLSNPSFILTTQLANWSQRFLVRQLDMLSMDSACEFLKNQLSEIYTINDGYIKDLCEKVQCLPLALQQSVAYIKQCAMTIVEYIEEFNLQTEDVLSNAVEDEAYNKTIATTWSMALKKIREHTDSEFILSFLGMLSYLDGKDINKKLFTSSTDQYKVNKAISVLQKYSLISVFTNTENLDQSIQIHSLVQMVVKLEPENKSQFFLKQILQIIFKSKANTDTRHVDYGLYWWDHLVYIFLKEKSNELVIAKIFENTGLLFDTVSANAKWGVFMQMLSFTDDMKNKLAMIPLDYYKGQVLIATCLDNQGKYEAALKMFLNLEKSMLGLFGSKHSDVLILSNKIALCSVSLGDVGLALTRYFDIEKVATEIFGENHPFSVVLQDNIGLCLHFQGHYDLALERFLKVEEKALEIFGENDPDFLTLQNNIALSLLEQGNHEMALKKYLDIEKLTINVLGVGHPSCIILQNNIAACYESKGEFDMALQKYLESEQNIIKMLGPTHPTLFLVKNNIALCYIYKGNYDVALKMCLDIEKSILEILGSRHPQVLMVQNNIGLCFQYQNKIECALNKYLQIEEILGEVLGTKHPDFLKTKQNIALCHQTQGNFEIALSQHLEVEKSALERLGKQHRVTLCAQDNIAVCLVHQKHFDRAIEIYSDIEKSYLLMFGSAYPGLFSIRNDIALCHLYKENYDLALTMLLDLEKSMLDLFGPKHEQLLTNQNNIGLCYQKQNKIECALEKYLEVEKSLLELLGSKKHPDLLTTQVNIGKCLMEQEQFEQALNKFQDVEDSALEVFGPIHPNIQKLKSYITLCLQKIEDSKSNNQLSQSAINPKKCVIS